MNRGIYKILQSIINIIPIEIFIINEIQFHELLNYMKIEYKYLFNEIRINNSDNIKRYIFENGYLKEIEIWYDEKLMLESIINE